MNDNTNPYRDDSPLPLPITEEQFRQIEAAAKRVLAWIDADTTIPQSIRDVLRRQRFLYDLPKEEQAAALAKTGTGLYPAFESGIVCVGTFGRVWCDCVVDGKKVRISINPSATTSRLGEAWTIVECREPTTAGPISLATPQNSDLSLPHSNPSDPSGLWGHSPVIDSIVANRRTVEVLRAMGRVRWLDLEDNPGRMALPHLHTELWDARLLDIWSKTKHQFVNTSDLISIYGMSRMFAEGVRLFRPDAWASQHMSTQALRLPEREYRQPYPYYCVELPEGFRFEQCPTTSPIGALLMQEDTWVSIVAYSADHQFGYTMFRHDGDIEEFLNSPDTIFNQPGQQDMFMALMRVAINSSLFLTHHPYVTTYANPTEAERLKALLNHKSQTRRHNATLALGQQWQVITTNQSIKAIIDGLYKRRTAVGTGMGSPKRHHIRHGHNRHLRSGKDVWINEFKIHAERFFGDPGETSVIIQGGPKRRPPTSSAA